MNEMHTFVAQSVEFRFHAHKFRLMMIAMAMMMMMVTVTMPTIQCAILKYFLLELLKNKMPCEPSRCDEMDGWTMLRPMVRCEFEWMTDLKEMGEQHKMPISIRIIVLECEIIEK